MERAGSHRAHVRLVDVILLNLLQNFTIHGERLVSLVIRAAA